MEKIILRERIDIVVGLAIFCGMLLYILIRILVSDEMALFLCIIFGISTSVSVQSKTIISLEGVHKKMNMPFFKDQIIQRADLIKVRYNRIPDFSLPSILFFYGRDGQIIKCPCSPDKIDLVSSILNTEISKD